MKKLIQLHPKDNVAIIVRSLQAGENVTLGDINLQLSAGIGSGHKVALVPIVQGEKVRRNNVNIGSASQDIAPGEHVHLHNLKSDYIPTLNKHYHDREVTP